MPIGWSYLSGVDNVFNIKRVELPADVSPGSQVTFQFNIVAPENGIGAGINKLFKWKMLRESVEWFGVATPLVNIRIVPKSGTTTVVPDVREIKWTPAKQMLLDTFLNPTVTGDIRADSWVYSQFPIGGTVVAAGSTVKITLRTGPIP